jgi:hypothetical protein
MDRFPGLRQSIISPGYSLFSSVWQQLERSQHGNQDYWVLNKLKWVEIGEVCPRVTSSQRHEYIIQMASWSINSNFAECYSAQ